MPNLTLSIPSEMHEKMSKHKEIRWSEVARRAIFEKLIILENLDKIASKSKMTMNDVMSFDRLIKKKMRSHFDELLNEKKVKEV